MTKTSDKKDMIKCEQVITKEEFLQLNEVAAKNMSADENLQMKARDVLIEADRYRWIHQTTWFGEPILNLPQDMFTVQDIIWRTRPDFVIEIGIAWGGGMLFAATLLELLGGSQVIGVDVYLPKSLRERLENHENLSRKLILIEGSSISDEVFSQIQKIVGSNKKVMVLLDSNHTHEHVIQELRMYSELVGKGQYLICGDTIVEYIPPQVHRPRPWGPGNNPATALQQFLKETDRFVVDDKIDRRLLFSCNPGGYLQAIK